MSNATLEMYMNNFPELVKSSFNLVQKQFDFKGRLHITFV